LFCIDGEPLRMAKSFSADQPFYSLFHAYDPDFVPPERIEELASIYIREIRRIQPKGPYNLIGFCVGGLTAYEMALQLLHEGEEIGYLALLDPTIPEFIDRSRWQWIIESFSHKGYRLRAAKYLGARAIDSLKARAQLAMRLMLGHTYKRVGADMSLRLRHIQNQGRIRRSHQGYRYQPVDLEATVFLNDIPDERWGYARNYWQSIFRLGANPIRIAGLSEHFEFLIEPHISIITKMIDTELQQRFEKNNTN